MRLQLEMSQAQSAVSRQSYETLSNTTSICRHLHELVLYISSAFQLESQNAAQPQDRVRQMPTDVRGLAGEHGL